MFGRTPDIVGVAYYLVSLGTLALMLAALQYRVRGRRPHPARRETPAQPGLRHRGAPQPARRVRVHRPGDPAVTAMTGFETPPREYRICSDSEQRHVMNLPSFPNVDLFSAGINALNGVLVARNPSHDRGYTLMGLLIMAFFGGIGGGVSRDLLLNEIPGAAQRPDLSRRLRADGSAGPGDLSLRRGRKRSSSARGRWRSSSRSRLPWFAILGAHKALEHDLGIFAAIVIGVLATTAGGVLIDLFSGVTPEVVMPSEHVVTTAVLASLIYALIAMYAKGIVLLLRHADRGSGGVPLPRVCGPGPLAADRAVSRRPAQGPGTRAA